MLPAGSTLTNALRTSSALGYASGSLAIFQIFAVRSAQAFAYLVQIGAPAGHDGRRRLRRVDLSRRHRQLGRRVIRDAALVNDVGEDACH